MGEGAQHAGPTVVLDRLSKDFGDVRAVDDISLTIAGGSFVALVGQSGSGKSTLLKTINRLIESGAGRVSVDGEDVALAEPFRLRRRIGYVFQNVGLFPHMNVGENIMIGRRIAGEAQDEARLAELLDLVELPGDFATRMPSELSGGQAQRVGVARALAGDSKLMLMDEPFGALDPVTRQSLGAAYRKLHDRLALTTIMVTHDMAEALLLADRVLVMADGRIVADATPREMLAGNLAPEAEALVAVPREQAERLVALESPETGA